MSHQVHPILGKTVKNEFICSDTINPFLLNDRAHTLGLQQHWESYIGVLLPFSFPYTYPFPTTPRQWGGRAAVGHFKGRAGGAPQHVYCGISQLETEASPVSGAPLESLGKGGRHSGCCGKCHMKGGNRSVMCSILSLAGLKGAKRGKRLEQAHVLPLLQLPSTLQGRCNF